MYELSGKIKLITDKQTFGSGFEKQEFVVTTQEKYPQDVKLELTGDKIGLIQGYQVGDQLNVKFNLRGNEYNGRYFVNLRAWDLAPIAGGGSGSAPSAEENNSPNMGQVASQPAPSPNSSLPDEDDLPF